MDKRMKNSDEARFCDIDKMLEETKIEIAIGMILGRIKEDEKRIGELLKKIAKYC